MLTPEDSTRARRVTLYLHEDDYAALMHAKIDDRVDINTRFRAMVALWRSNKRYGAAVDRLGRSAR